VTDADRLAWLEEHYFHWQLMHDTRADWRRLRASGWLRRSFLSADLAAAAPASRGQ
jgi:hypothetical protein